MGRPLKTQNIEREKELTFAICSQIKAGSGLSFAKLEQSISEAMPEALKVGDGGGRVFARYCDKAPEKRHMASRDKLAAWLRLALKNGWVERDFAKRYRAWIGDPSHPAPSEIAERRHELESEFLLAVNNARKAVFRVFELAVENQKEMKICFYRGPNSVKTSAGGMQDIWFSTLNRRIQQQVEKMESEVRALHKLKKPPAERIKKIEDEIELLRLKQDAHLSSPDILELADVGAKLSILEADFKYEYFKEASPPSTRPAIDTKEVDKLIAEMELILANHKSVNHGNSTSKTGAKVVQLRPVN